MDQAPFILTGWGREKLTAKLANKFGIAANSSAWRQFVDTDVAVAKAAFQDQCWWQLLGTFACANRVPASAALAAIHLGCALREHLAITDTTPLVVSHDKAAAIVGHSRQPLVRWVAGETIAPLMAMPLTSVTLAQAVPNVLDASNRLRQVDGSIAKKLAQAEHPVWTVPIEIGAGIVVAVSGQNRLRKMLYSAQEQVRQGNQRLPERLTAIEDVKAMQYTQRQIANGEEWRFPLDVLADPAAWEAYAPRMAATWQRLDGLKQTLTEGADAHALAMELVRALDIPAFVFLGLFHREGWPLHSLATVMKPPVTTLLLQALNGYWDDVFFSKRAHAFRAVWQRIHHHLGKGTIESLITNMGLGEHYQGENAILANMLGMGSAPGPRYPLTVEERAIVDVARQKLDQARQEKLAQQAEAARRAQLNKAERKRLEQEEAAQRQRAMDAARLAEVAALTPGRRAIAILKDEEYWRGRWQDLDPAWQQAAEALLARRQEKADQRAAEKRAKEEELLRQLAQEPIPISRYLTITEMDWGVRVYFDPPEALTRGSRSLCQDICYAVRSRLSQARFGRLADGQDPVNDWQATVVEARVPRTEMTKLTTAVAEIDRIIDKWQQKPLAPYHLEQVLGITQVERYRWTKAGKFTIVGHDTFTKGRREIEYPLFSRMQIFALSPATIAAWRQQDAEATAARRKAGARKAVETRVVNKALREDERMRIDTVARDAARAKGDLSLIALAKLGIYAQLASRWAKTYQARGNRQESDHFYAMKDRALRVLAGSQEARLAFVAAQMPRVSVDLCREHREYWRQWRRELRDMTDFDEWLEMNLKLIRNCPDCCYSRDRHYYSLYLIEFEASDLRLSFHVPYPIGRSYLPQHDTLPQLKDEPDEGMFRYGRPVTAEEMLLHPAKEVENELTALLEFFRTTDKEAAKRPPQPPASSQPFA